MKLCITTFFNILSEFKIILHFSLSQFTIPIVPKGKACNGEKDLKLQLFSNFGEVL